MRVRFTRSLASSSRSMYRESSSCCCSLRARPAREARLFQSSFTRRSRSLLRRRPLPLIVPFEKHHVLPGHFIVLLDQRSEEHTSELQSQSNLVCRLLLEKKKINQ